jgi:cytochrome c oxidase subunit 3
MAQTSMSVQGKRSGASPVRFGTILFLASELLFFGGLFAAYFALRAQTSPWPPEGVELDVRLSAVATALLLISSFTFHAGVSAAERGRPDRAGRGSGRRSRWAPASRSSRSTTTST